MKITLTDAGKRFNREWIFRHLSYQFQPGISYGITGPNGSGKSTLLQLIAGAISPSEGKLQYQLDYNDPGTTTAVHSPSTMKDIETDRVHEYISLSAPYLEVIEEMSLVEFFRFHETFKPFMPGLAINEMMALVGLKHAANKQIRYFSSGMKQRVKLAQALFTYTPVVLLDEPCTNLDSEGISLYQELMATYGENRLVVVSSNDIQEYAFCKEKIDIMQYKQPVNAGWQ